MHDALGRHHHDFPLDELEFLILVDDANLDHPTDVPDGERSAGEAFSGCGHGNVHGSALLR
ncbi:MAG TPA: hypothetical protein VMM15_18690 [Bradyrhizobium sp.]|nr:hypothetical protein [Bradyrhizobium sp.]